ncbi:MAG TPA: Rieske 2Fe-2S domain-containing protein [Streptosporangiaceae bacterium]|nr:Rieske 2Fe-2S domain-containing protein [Streptosporangiaceae bacterium]
MSDMEETGGHEAPEGSEDILDSEDAGGPVAPRRVIGTPPPTPRLLGRGPGASGDGADLVPAQAGAAAVEGHGENRMRSESDYPDHARNAERLVVVLFLIAFLAGCAFIAAYVGLGVYSVDKVFRSNLALGLSLSVTLLCLGLGALIWVRHLMPDVEFVEERHDLRSTPAERAAFQEYFEEGAAASQFVKRPMVRRTLMLATLPLVAAPLVLLRDMGPLPKTSLRHTVWSPGRRLLVYGTNQPITPAEFSAPGGMITIVPDGYQDDLDALAKAAVIIIKFRPGELNIPTRYAGSTLIGTQNWTVDNIVAYSKICTHVGCPVALYEQTTHHILCPCHQSTFEATTGATVIFGPAPRPLPQLPLTVDSSGYLVAQSDFTQPVGPSFWERG